MSCTLCGGRRPATCPVCAPDEEDDDDRDPHNDEPCDIFEP